MLKINLITKHEQAQLDKLREAHWLFIDNIKLQPIGEFETLIFRGFVPIKMFNKEYENIDNLLRSMLKKIYHKDIHIGSEYSVKTEDILFVSSMAEVTQSFDQKYINYVLRFKCLTSKLIYEKTT